MKPKIFLADLTHSASGVSALVFPLGTGFVASYAQKILGNISNIEWFSFDFEAIKKLKFEVDPRKLKKAAQKEKYGCFHESHQQEIIETANNLYKNHPGGIGRLIQQSNLNKMFRKVERVRLTAGSS